MNALGSITGHDYGQVNIRFKLDLYCTELVSFLHFPIDLQSVMIHSDTFSKWCVGKRGRLEGCSVAPLCNKRVKTLCCCRGKKRVQTKEKYKLRLTTKTYKLSVEWLAGETEVLGKPLPQCRFINHKSPHDLTRTRRSIVQFVLVSGTRDQFFFFVFLEIIFRHLRVCYYLGRPLWREDRYVIYGCCWASPALSFVRVPWDSRANVIVSNLRPSSQSEGSSSRIYFPQEQGSPVILPGIR
jgi:hypothetical protein